MRPMPLPQNRIGDMASDIRKLEQEASSLKHDVDD